MPQCLNMTVYLDNAAATPIDNRVKKEMSRSMDLCGNPSSFNDGGRAARVQTEQARAQIARFINARPEEIVFTSSGSEANNTAIFGVADKFRSGHIISTAIEHPSVLEPIGKLAGEGFKIDLVSVDAEGFVNPRNILNLIKKDTVLISVMYANNEIGTIEPIREIGKLLKEYRSKLPLSARNRGPLFHVDACQATEYLNMNVHELGVDFLTFNGSKIYGPKGIGVLYVKRDLEIKPLILGGNQERGRRAGTENTAAILGLAKAISLINKKENKKLPKLQDYFISNILKKISDVRLNGPKKNRLPNNINISIFGVGNEEILLQLDKHGIHAGSGSACTSHAVEPSHVLKAIGVPKKYLNGAIRFSLGRQTIKKDIDYVLKVLPKVIEKCRSLR
ncbi:MAG: Cysteine desulfurase [Candidatus Yanofskybacteria bacterium GW2011_GWA1_44_21]|uniref:Cysteine desulfurase n=3 Tax=Parcubacteria group TaxID=1794811 RepID=A0A0G0XL55_9BACT|nr:MAG: Cysteine desulfurase [Candidatus Wolfebacteria bacterium GW2011_GWA2_42_10]KKT50334.1 MAG: Cysteine desulfurase [Candidatus Yanofskybacteria bacterium GW2011_GWA1_44_21]KKT90173.1 MAG: Cysteine desulfurase [Candidatus Yanofskybacteria bacterium GW2011_GWB1_45_11]OGN03397.1 MAG: hypothetical protein A2657_00470 [Candidatus Yanofskybacteria bacterium RIFCSPHIGHO2_01_FULL_44_110b]OGN14998.1 MAG: hypothetical protein A3C01_02705 [Candidatus Yanofskybacteria bacterium RIFCSPHIGHO2_02_FULL_44